MSTRSTIAYEEPDQRGIGYHLYTDWSDPCGGKETVHLELTGVPFTASSDPELDLALPRTLARRLGLLPAAPARPTPTDWPSAAVQALLQQIYSMPQASRWWSAPHPVFQGRSPQEMVAAGQESEVVDLLRGVLDGTYV